LVLSYTTNKPAYSGHSLLAVFAFLGAKKHLTQCAQSIAGDNLFEGNDNAMSADLDPISLAATWLKHRFPFDVSGSHRFLVDAESIGLLQEKFPLRFGIASGPVFT
jgi:hypothetical protein